METDFIPGRPRTLETLSEKSVDIFSKLSTTAQNDFLCPNIDLLTGGEGGEKKEGEMKTKMRNTI